MLQMIKVAGEVHLSRAVLGYVVTVTAATRTLPEVRLGVSPRGSLALAQAAQAARRDAGTAVRDRPTTSRPWPRRCWRTGSCCGPRPSWRATPRRSCSRRCSRRCRCRPSEPEVVGPLLTGSGWAVVAATVLLLGAGAAAGYPELLVLGLAGLVVLVVAGVWMALGPNVVARREVRPLRVTEGETARGVLTVTNVASRRSPPFLAVERMGERRIRVPLPSLPPGASTTAAYPLPTDRRGVHPVGPLGIGHTDPLRLMRLGGEYASTTVLRVHPRVHAVEPLPTGYSRDMDGPTSSTAPSGGVAFHSLREYEPGDDTRLVHAKSSARAGTLMVRHNVVPNEPRMMVVLDTSAASVREAARSRTPSGSPRRWRCPRWTTASRWTCAPRPAPSCRPTGPSAARSCWTCSPASSAPPTTPGWPRCRRWRRRDDGVSLGVVTGHPDPARRAFVARVRPRFQMVSLVHVGPRAGRPEPTRGALVLDVATSEEFAAAWDRLVRR